MMENKKGMSAVVTTLIIILLVIVALGIIWVVVKNVIDSGVEQVDLSTKCREVEIQAVALTEPTVGNYTLTLRRTGTGDDIGGIKIVFANTTSNDYSSPITFDALAPLQTATQTFTDTGVENANKIEMTVFFVDDLGAEQLCAITIDEEF